MNDMGFRVESYKNSKKNPHTRLRTLLSLWANEEDTSFS